MDLNRMLSALNNSGIASGFAGGLAGSALRNTLISKRGRKVADTALKIGGIAAVGGLAFSAYLKYQRNQTQLKTQSMNASAVNSSQVSYIRNTYNRHPKNENTSVVNNRNWQQLAPSDFDIQTDTEKCLLLLRAMISAANTDGHIDTAEREKIFQQVEQQNLAPEEKAVLFKELSNPPSLEQICSSVNDSAMAAEVYTISMLVTDSRSPLSTHYLEALARRLVLPKELITHIHNQAQ